MVRFVFFPANTEPQHELLNLHRYICLLDFYQNKVLWNFPLLIES